MPDLTGLDADRLVEQAREATGLSDLGEDTWREGLDRLLWSLREEAALSDLGVVVVQTEMVSYLTRRLGIVDEHRRVPYNAAADVTPPIVIIGQARTGTTILFELLGQDPEHRVPLSWEVDLPTPPPEPENYETDPRIEQAQAFVDASETLIPGFLAMHPIGARLGQECVRITGGDFRSLIFCTQYRIPSYGRWVLHEADMAPAYRYHRLYLQHLQSRHRKPRWVLKSPAHLWCLGALLHEYPDALLVQTHRDPLKIIASVSSLQAKLRTLASSDVQLPEIANEWADYILLGLERGIDAREDKTVRPDRVVDVQFRDFMADPFATIHAIYERLGLSLSTEAERHMRDYLAANPSDKHGAHSYSFADTGLDAGDLRARAKRYQEYFEVPDESLG
ncbi:MAG: sulfotransferase family protein [Actinomycetota bacterium]